MDDRPISTIPEEAMWSENYAYMINSRTANIAAFCLMGRWIPDPSIWREFLMVKLPDDTILHHKSWGRATTRGMVSASLAGIDILPEPNRFQLRFDGPIAATDEAALYRRGTINQSLVPCQIDLAMSSNVPVWDMSHHSNTTADITGKMHVEQVGVASGTITVDGVVYELQDAFMQRDHSRGVRDVSNFHRHCWAQGSFPDRDLTFNLYSMIAFGREPMMNASISQGGRRYAAEILEIGYMESRADVRKPYVIVVRSELGEMRFEVVDFVASFPTAFVSPWDINAGIFPEEHHVTALEEAVVWEWDGVRGDGWSERSFTDRPFASARDAS